MEVEASHSIEFSSTKLHEASSKCDLWLQRYCSSTQVASNDGITTATEMEAMEVDVDGVYDDARTDCQVEKNQDLNGFVFSLVDHGSDAQEKDRLDGGMLLDVAAQELIYPFTIPIPEGQPPVQTEAEVASPCPDVGNVNPNISFTPLERHSTAEILITTPVKRCFSRVTNASFGAGPSTTFQLEAEGDSDDDDSDTLLSSPLYCRIVVQEETPTFRKKSKVPSALPLQKVLKRKALEMDSKEGPVYFEESDGEVVILMDGIMTKVGKPNAPANSGKIYSTAQNCPVTVKWLLENFESMVGQSLPRSFVYDQYVQHCALNKIESVNAASFGKLIRSVFLGLRTRRLGTRGNSKYHYYGIKIKETSHLLPILNSIRAEQDLLNDTVNGRIRKRVRRTQSVYTGKHVKGLVIDRKIETLEKLGNPKYVCPDIRIEKSGPLPEGIDEALLISFEEIYKRHCQKIVNFFREFKLIDVLAEIVNFWRVSLPFKRKGLEDYSAALPKSALFNIMSMEATTAFIARMDLYMYQHVINTITPSVLRPLPLQMLQAIDNLIQDLLSTMPIALNGYPKIAAHNKLRSLTAFVRVWKQYSKLSQLSDFIELTLENETSVSNMRNNISQIRLAHVCDRAATDVESEIMTFQKIFDLMVSFVDTLEKEQSLEIWCEWAHERLLEICEEAKSSPAEFGVVTAGMHNTWLIVSNLIVSAIREMSGSDASLFVPLLQWCGEMMQFFRQRKLDELLRLLPVSRFYMEIIDEDMSISFTDRPKAKALTQVKLQEESEFPVPVFIPTSVRVLDEPNTASTTNNAIPQVPTEFGLEQMMVDLNPLNACVKQEANSLDC